MWTKKQYHLLLKRINIQYFYVSIVMNQLELVANRRGALAWIYKEIANDLEIWNRRWTVIIMVAAVVFGASGVLSVITNNEQLTKGKYKPILIVIQVLAVICSGLPAIQAVYNYGARIKAAQEASTSSYDLFAFIKDQIEDKIEVSVILKKARAKDGVLRNSDPRVPDRIIQKYRTQFGNSAIRYDVLFGDRLDGPYLETVAASSRHSPAQKLILEKYHMLYQLHDNQPTSQV